MGKIGYGYGSECHLLRWMGRHRNSFDKAVSLTIRIDGNDKTIKWLDFGFNDRKSNWFGSEPTRLDFLEDENTRTKWKWPKSGTQQNWDGVGYIESMNNPTQDLRKEIILLEAKAHVDEANTSCQAGIASLSKIKDIFHETARGLNIHNFNKVEHSWLHKYYQTANRLATYNYLKVSGYNPHLVFLYFINDQHKGKTCPSQVSEWEIVLSMQKKDMGIDDVFINERVYNLFLDARSDTKCWTSSSEEFLL